MCLGFVAKLFLGVIIGFYGNIGCNISEKLRTFVHGIYYKELTVVVVIFESI